MCPTDSAAVRVKTTKCSATNVTEGQPHWSEKLYVYIYVVPESCRKKSPENMNDKNGPYDSKCTV